MSKTTSMDLINHFLQSYGYLAVFLFVALESVGSPVPGETAVIAVFKDSRQRSISASADARPDYRMAATILPGSAQLSRPSHGPFGSKRFSPERTVVHVLPPSNAGQPGDTVRGLRALCSWPREVTPSFE